MTIALSEDLKRRIVAWYTEDGMTMAEIAAMASCSIGLVSKVLQLQREFGQVTHPFSRQRCASKIFGRDDYLYLEEIIAANPAIYLDEIQAKFASVRSLFVSISTIARALNDINMTRKKITKQSAERNQRLRNLWEMEMAQYMDPELFVALDESAVDNKTVQRNYGRSMEGQPCVCRKTFLRGTRYSMLPALTTDGIVALDIFEVS